MRHFQSSWLPSLAALQAMTYVWTSRRLCSMVNRVFKSRRVGVRKRSGGGGGGGDAGVAATRVLPREFLSAAPYAAAEGNRDLHRLNWRSDRFVGLREREYGLNTCRSGGGGGGGGGFLLADLLPTIFMFHGAAYEAFFAGSGVAGVGASRPFSMRRITTRTLPPSTQVQPLVSVVSMSLTRGMGTASVPRQWAAVRAAPSCRSALPPPPLAHMAALPRPLSTLRACFASTSDLPKEFCIAGPTLREEHYALDISNLSQGNVDDPAALFHLERCVKAIRKKQYFTIHGARQSMKTSFLRALQRHINTDDTLKDDYECVYVTLERMQTTNDDKLSICREICDKFATAAQKVGDDRPLGMLQTLQSRLTPLSALLSNWSYRLWTEEKKNLVILFDEFDNLSGEPLLFVLGELRGGYVDRGDHRYPTSVVLCGMRRLHDYKMVGKSILGTSSPFNVALGPLHTVPLTRDQVAELYAQHTATTGQPFEEAAVKRAFYWTQGQPWLVNRIGYEVTTHMAESGRLPPTEAVTVAHIDTAVSVMIDERSSHLDSLMSVLRDERVRSVMENVLRGEAPEAGIDSTFCFELGLLAPDADDYRVANPLYEQVLPRAILELFEERRRLAMRFAAHRLVVPETGGFDLSAFVRRFCDFMREHMARSGIGEDDSSVAFRISERDIESFLLASVYHSINGSGKVHRQQQFGERRADITIELPRMRLDDSGERYAWNDANSVERIVLELKMGANREKGVKDVAQQFTSTALAQVVDYAQRWGRVDRMALIVFDTNKVAMEGTDRRTSLYHTVIPAPTDMHQSVECFSLHLPLPAARRGRRHQTLRMA